MRFHIGFSKRISKKTIIFLLGLLSLAFAIFFGNTEIVFASEQTTNQCPGYMAYYRDNASDSPIAPGIQSNTADCYIIVNNSGMNAYNFVSSYDFGSLCSSKRANITIRMNLMNNQGAYFPTGMSIQGVTNGTPEILSSSSSQSQMVVKFKNVNTSLPLSFVTNTSTPGQYSVYYSVVGRSITYECITDVAESVNNASQDIMNNDNQNTQTIVDSFTQNTQDIIDNQNSDNVSTANSTGTSFFNNFHIDDTRGLTSIVTAPIRLLQGIVNSNETCSDYTFSIQILGTQSKNVTLPSGCILWNNVPQAVVVSYWIIVWAIIGYRCLVDMIHFASSLRDPDKKNDYTLDL